VSNFSAAQMDSFRGIVPLHTAQPPFNLFGRDAEADILRYSRANGIATLAYGPLSRGLLSGRITRDTRFNGMTFASRIRSSSNRG
jgi:aryl-alcohol dehydrogenase-like predicted oxidoreductase